MCKQPWAFAGIICERSREHMITIKNTQHKIRVSTQRLRTQAAAMLTALGYADFDLGVWLTTNKTIRRYNKTFRSKDEPTDILSFPYHTTLRPGKKITVKQPDDKNLGDLIIALEYTKRDAATTWGCSLDERLTALLAHGIAHLLGHNHHTDAAFKQMQQLEAKLFKTV